MAKIALPGFHVARAGQLTVGNDYTIWLHSDPQEKVSKVRLVERPACAVRDMADSDEFVFRLYNENGNLTKKELRLRRNNTFPHYLVTTVAGNRADTTKTVRMSILEADKAEAPEPAKA